MTALPVADAHAQAMKTMVVGDRRIEYAVPGLGSARVLSLKGQWQEIPLSRQGGSVSTNDRVLKGGMSGSPIISANGDAIAVVSTEMSCPVIVDRLPAQLVREILATNTDAT
jgi:hypothetical protein